MTWSPVARPEEVPTSTVSAVVLTFADGGVARRFRAGAGFALQDMRRIDLDVRVAKLRAAREGDAIFHFGARMLDVDIDCERRADAEALAFAAARSRHRDGDAVGRVGCFQVDVAAAERDRRAAAAHDRLVLDLRDADRDRAGDAGVAAARARSCFSPEHAGRFDERVRLPGPAGSETDGMTGKRVRARGGELGGGGVIAGGGISLVGGKP